MKSDAQLAAHKQEIKLKDFEIRFSKEVANKNLMINLIRSKLIVSHMHAGAYECSHSRMIIRRKSKETYANKIAILTRQHH